jgi:Fe-S cluster biogenesis protein NfuA
MNDMTVFYEATPNPQSMKFIVTAEIASESCQFTSGADASRSPLAQKILGFPWASGVFIGANFVTVTKQDWVDWDIIADPLADLIKEHLQRGEGVLSIATHAAADEDESQDSPIVRHIKQILRDEIRPAVAMDGGDITFHKYEDGRVFLHMQGACAGCPSSAYTLKEGIETRLKEAIPEIQEVVPVM